MKVEMGESLVRTWLRHCRGCQLAELNWKPSPMWSAEITTEQKKWYEEGTALFSQQVFKKNSGIVQFLAQAEIDVLGIKFEHGKAEKVIATDVAYHTNGLHYGSKIETQSRIIKKLFRTALLLDLHFPNIPAEIVFLSPKVNPATASAVLEAEEFLKTFFKARLNHYEFRSIINRDFKHAVLDELTPLQTEVADTSELFLRAAQLLGLFATEKPREPQVATVTPSLGNKATLPIELVPCSPDQFKQLLMERGATKFEHYEDGSIKTKAWPATGITERSNIIGNLRSSTEYRQGEWQKRKMTKLVVKIDNFDNTGS